LVRELHADLPIFGVCLGHQTIAEALGGEVTRGNPMHGSASLVTHDGTGLFQDVTSPLRVGRYHSLIVDETTLPSSLTATAWTADRVVMALAHQDYPVFGVQFHPESILTQDGYRLLANFLHFAGVETSINLSDLAASELRIPTEATPLPRTVTPHAWREA
jgi:anthranilate synthase/aminodeoxychorismate synthase-like glutamine amidotransferase